MTATDRDFFTDLVDMMPTERPPQFVSAFIEGNRNLPSSTPYPGLWRNDRTPYLVEIMDCFSPFSPIRRVVLMKGAQIGATAVAENIMGFWMKANPTEILYVSASEDLLEKWGTKRLEPLIDSLGMRGLMATPTKQAGSRRTGDKMFAKQFLGGALDMASARSAPSLRSDSKRILIRDEIDGAPAMLTTGEGNWLDVSQARTNAWGARAKILDLSTPKTEEASNIGPAYEEGDRRQWFMPCPHCGQHQSLSLTLENFPKRFIPTYDDKHHLVSVELVCEHCAKRITEAQKSAMVRAGEWRPTGIPHRATTRSYHLPSTVSLMMTWVDLYAEFEKTKIDPAAASSFTNLYLGWPYRESGRKPMIEANAKDLRGAYKQGDVPHGVLFLTMSVDVQTGKDARLEVAVWGHGLGYRTWLIDHRKIMGATEFGPTQGAWADLDAWGRESRLTYLSTAGRQFPIQLVFIDSGDGNVTTTVYQFCAGWRNTFPIKGEQDLVPLDKRSVKGDAAGKISETGYRLSKLYGTSGQALYLIGTNHYKSKIYSNLLVERVGASAEKLPQPPHFIDFPEDIPDEFFTQLVSEERRRDGSFHPVHKGIRTEALDLTVYAWCAADVWLHAQTQNAREKFRRDHPEVSMHTIVENITPRHTLEYLARSLGVGDGYVPAEDAA